MEKTLAIIGCGGMGLETLWAVNEVGFNNVVLVDDNEDIHGTEIHGCPVIGSIEDCIKEKGIDNIEFMCAVGSVDLKREFVKRIGPDGNYFSAVAPGVHKSEFVYIGKGTLICTGSIITTQVVIENHVIVNIDSTIGHDVVVEDYVNISPGVHISGYCTLKEGCNIGLGANILPRITIGKNSIVGAGATVTKDVPDNAVVVGVPAKIMREL